MTSLPSVFSSSAHFGPSGIPPPVLRYDVEELQLFVTKSVICSPALLRMLKSKTSASIELFTVKWEKYIFCPFYFLQLQTLLLLLFSQSLLCLAAPSLSPSLRLTLFLVLCAISPLRSHSSWFMLPSNSPLRTQSFCLAAFRNHLFCIYFIAIRAFSDSFFLVSSSFYLFFSNLGLLLTISPIFWCIFQIQIRANT